LALVGLTGNGKDVQTLPAHQLLRLGGDALATGLDERRTAEEVARLAVQGTGAEGAVVWRLDEELRPSVSGAHGTGADAGAERLAVYLLEPDEDRLLEASGRGLAGPHTRVAERLIELARGPLRRQEAILIDDAKADLRLAPVREQLTETGIEAAVGLPLRVREDLIGLLALYPPSGRTLTADALAPVTALAAQLAVAFQHARLHEAA